MKNNMFNNLPINDLMKEMLNSAEFAEHLSVDQVIDKAVEGEEDEIYRPMTEIEAFCQIDSLCADLFLRLEEAKSQLLQIIKDHGEDSPMAEIARDMVESAETSLEVRLIELRDDEESSGEAGAIAIRVNQAIEEEKESFIARKKENPQNLFARLAMKDREDRQKKKKKSANEIILMLAMYIMWIQNRERLWDGMGMDYITEDPMKSHFMKAVSAPAY